jgi:hypothetical protein
MGDADGRDVVVPLRLYKTVIVFATLIAVALVIAGFVVLDVATQRATLPTGEVDPLAGLLGVGLIAGGAAVYAFASRFRAEGMGKDKEQADEGTDDG